MTLTKKTKEWINIVSPLITALATVALVIVTICYVGLLREQTALHEDPILKINPNEWSISGERPGVFTVRVCNTGFSDIKSIKVFQDCFVPVADSPLVICRVGDNYLVTPDQTIPELESGKTTMLRIEFSSVLDDMAKLLANKKGSQYRILRLKMKFYRAIDEKEYSLNQFYIIAGHGDVLMAEDERKTFGVDIIPLAQIKRALGGD